MMERFKIALLLVCSGVLPLFCFSQNYGEVSFSYDSNGNRISSSIMFRADNRDETDKEGEYLSKVSELFGDMEVSLYPNPTPDCFTMSVKGVESKDVRILLFTTEGVALEEKTMRDGVARFDLSSRAVGVYLVRLTMNGISKTWKVLKQ